jgi:DNA-binding beta-propeller fold protein YncE
MPEPSSRPTPPAEAISAYRHALLRNAPADELTRLAAALDPETVAWLDLFQASRRETIRPDSAFVRRLERAIAAAPGPQLTRPLLGSMTPLRLIRAHAANGRRTQTTTQATIPARPSVPWHTAWPQSAARLTAAVLLIALLVGSTWMALYPLRLWDNEGLPLFAVQETPATADSAPTLEFLWDANGDPDPMVNPYGVGVDPEGNVWVSDGVNDRFQIFAPDGTFLETWGESGSEEGQFDFRATHGNAEYDYGDVAFDEEGNVYVADTGNFRVQKFAPDRSFLLSWGGEGTDPGQMMAPGGVAIGPDGTVYVVDENRSDVQMFTADGALIGAFGEPGAEDGQFSAPAGIATDSAGDVWVADFGNNRIQRFSPDGDFLSAWGTLGAGDGALHNPNDVAIDAAGRVFVADLNNYRLQVLTPEGDFLAEIGGMGSEPGQFFTPNAVAVDAEGVAYVSDNYRLQAFRLVLPGEESSLP